MSLSSPDSATYTTFDSSPSPNSSATSVKVRSTNSLPVPIPVPNLTKKSRGRRVPTVPNPADNGGKGVRTHTCKVPGCGKCFGRGEHLKRHIRSIHTYDKPHKCPYPGCGKEFSRHDNLGQHMRVHKDYKTAR
ncbi:hypothetical protein EV360DRAFT_91957 [Lentinula raphanica]|nr:hypothetical protein EV360DRAFT_91957 [Lentinula raphanica]